jgi:hypothetical protein
VVFQVGVRLKNRRGSIVSVEGCWGAEGVTRGEILGVLGRFLEKNRNGTIQREVNYN